MATHEEQQLAAFAAVDGGLLNDAEARRRLSLLLRSPDPLTSYCAASLVLEAARRPGGWPVGHEDWLGPMLAGSADGGPASLCGRSLANLLEACRRWALVVGVDGDEDDEESPERYIRATLVEALPRLQCAVLGLVEDGVPGAGEEDEEAIELALAWLLKLGKELHRSGGLAPDAVAALCHAAWAAAGRRAMRRGLPASCAGMVAPRQQILEVALALLATMPGGGDSGCGLRGPGLALSRRLLESEPADFPEASEDTDPAAGEGCSLVREARAADLLPYRLALLAAALRQAGEAAVVSTHATADAWQHLSALLGCPLRHKYMTGQHRAPTSHEEEESGDDDALGGLSSPLVAALLDRDDFLLGALNDLQRLGMALLTAAAANGAGGGGPSGLSHLALPDMTEEAGAVVGAFLQANSPLALFASLLEVVDEGLMLEYLVADETRALEYVMRAVKFLIWRQRRRQAEGDQGEGEDGDAEAVAEVGGFLVRLGDRLGSLSRRGLFPFDIQPLLGRIGELRELLESNK